MSTTGRPRADSGASTYTQLALGMAAFGSATPVSKIVTGAMPVFIASGLRVTLGAAVLLFAARGRLSQIKQIGREDWLCIGLIALFGMFGFSALMLYGMKMISGTAGAVVMSTTPAVTAIGSMLFLRERPGWRAIVAIALAVAGVLLLQIGAGRQPQGNDWLGIGLVFAAVCCEASYTLLGKRVSAHIDPVLVALLGAVIAIPLFLPFAIWQWQDFDAASIDARIWSALAWYGVGTLAIGSWLWYSGVAKAEGSVAAGFMGVMPASALLLSYVLLDEEFKWLHVLGFGVVFAGVLLISWEHARKSK
ncbi:MAG: DMT family transporter [Pseudomonadota bacterium]|nr:DMT family transporter [Pseudomonadota bacterium]